MIFHRLGLLHKNQRGFTLIELVIAIAITGLITSGITMTIFQVISGNARTSNHMIAVRQVQNAGYLVSQDAQMAQSVVITGTSGLILTWTDWDGTANQVVYTLEGSELQRSYSVNSGEPTVVPAARFVDSSNTSYAVTGGSAFDLPDTHGGSEDAFTITDAVGGDEGTITVTEAGGVVMATPEGGATVAGGTDPVTINVASGAVAWATPVAGSSIIVASNAMNSAGSWTATTGTATATMTTDNDDNATLSGGGTLVLTVTAKLGTGSQEASETRVYKITPRPSL